MTSRRARIVAPLVVVLALAGCTSGGSTEGSPSPSWPASVDAQQKGTPVMVNIWASWCTPCAAEAPDLIAAHRAYGDKVRFIGVDAQDDRAGATTFIGSHQVPYPSVFDPSNQIAVSYGLFSPPDTLFFDRTGTLVKTIPGQISRDDLMANLQAIAG
jgi:thiol-disulfide isomerase/thioredoxin